MSNVEVRVFRPADLPDLIALERSVYGSGAYSYYFFRQLYDLFPKLVWVAESEGKVIGHVCGAIAQDGTTGWILNLAVQAHFRRQGVGGRLVAACEENLRAGGATVVQTTLRQDNLTGIAALERIGYTRIAIEENYYGDDVERLIFEKKL